MKWLGFLPKCNVPFSALMILFLLTSPMVAQSPQRKNESSSSKKATTPVDQSDFGPIYSADRVRFQQQAAFGYSSDLDFEIRRRGISVYLSLQLDSPATSPTFPETALQPTNPRPICNGEEDSDSNPIDPPDSPDNCFRDSYSMYPIQQWFFNEALYGDAQLRLRVAWALSQIWVISGNEIKQSRHMTEYFKVLYKHALGSQGVAGEDYFNLMKEMTLNPGMGEYLDMSVSTRTRRNENYARELLQLFTTGVDKLDPVTGTVITDVNGKPIPVYSQEIVEDFARVFTGWTFCNINCSNARPGNINFIDPMELTPDNHNLEDKSLLGDSTNGSIDACPNCTGTAAGTYATTSLNSALRNIFNHPNVPFFVSRQLIQHLVMSHPSDAYVARVANKFKNNGSNVRGDMKEVVRAILLDPDARGDSKEGENGGKYGKLKEPVQYAANILRAFNGSEPNSQSDGVVFDDPTFLKMGQKPFSAPSVFNYYPPNHKIMNGTVSAPEFALMTATTAVSRVNFANVLVFAGIPNNIPPPTTYTTSLNLSEMEGLASDPANLIFTLNQRLMHGTMTITTQTAILNRLNAMSGNTALEKAKEAVYLAITSSQYQVQR